MCNVVSRDLSATGTKKRLSPAPWQQSAAWHLLRMKCRRGTPRIYSLHFKWLKWFEGKSLRFGTSFYCCSRIPSCFQGFIGNNMLATCKFLAGSVRAPLRIRSNRLCTFHRSSERSLELHRRGPHVSDGRRSERLRTN